MTFVDFMAFTGMKLVIKFTAKFVNYLFINEASVAGHRFFRRLYRASVE